MAIPSRPIGQDPVSQQLWNISKQLETLIKVTNAAGNTIVAYSDSLTFPITYASLRLRCDGVAVGNSAYTSETANNVQELVALFNNTQDATIYGRYSVVGTDKIALTTTNTIKNAYCPSGTLSLDVFSD